MTASVSTAPRSSWFGLYRSLWHFAAGSRPALVCGASLLIASQLLRLLLPWFAGQAINALQAGGPHFAVHAGAWIVALLATCVAGWALHGPGRVLERSVGVRVRRNVSGALFDKLANAPLTWHDRHAASDLQQRMSQASGALDAFAQNQYVVLQGVVTFVGTLGALIFFSPAIGVLAVLAYVVLVRVGMRFDRSMTRLAGRENEAERRFASGVLEFVGSIVTVSALRLQPSAKRLLGDRLDAVFVPLARSVRLNEAKWCVIDLLTTTLTWGVVAAYVWRSHGGGATVLLGGIFMIHRYAEQAGGVVSNAASNLQSFTRFRVDFASASPIWDAPARPARSVALAADWRRIELHNVSYRHDDPTAPPAADIEGNDGRMNDGRMNDGDEGVGRAAGIRHVSLAFERGERIALVGPSGSGKSTLMRVMAGLYEASHGHLSVDGIAHLDVGPLASLTTFIPQDADVFETTVWENIALDRLPDRDAVVRALRTSAFDDVLATLPDGLATPVAERGANLSGGQKQRLCLARGVLAATGSSLILLDEPTSALDPLAEAGVHRELDAHFPDACIVASVHRMGLLAHFDRVVLMDGGRVVDSGPVADVRARQPLLAAMMRAQAAPDEDLREAA